VALQIACAIESEAQGVRNGASRIAGRQQADVGWMCAMPQFGPLKIKLQLFCGPDTAFGPGKADLLEAIDREGSITAAGRAMGMSYRRTWLLVDTMNRCWAEPLVKAVAGGGAEKGARLTAARRGGLADYRAPGAELARAAERSEAMKALSSRLLERPRAAYPGE
jgi:molybdate transport system regulatory protein